MSVRSETDATGRNDWLARILDEERAAPPSEIPEEVPPPKEDASPTAEHPPVVRRRWPRVWIGVIVLLCAVQAITATLLLGRSEPVVPISTPLIVKERPAERQEFVVSAKGDGDYQSLAQAVAQAKPGMRIRVKPGVYSEPLILDKAVEIVGDGPVAEIILEAKDADAVQIKADGVVLRDVSLRVHTADKGADVYPLHVAQGRPRIENCDIRSESAGCVAIRGPEAQPILRGCTIHDGKGGGVLFANKAKGVLQGCRITGHAQAAVVISTEADPVLMNCTVSGSQDAGIIVNARGRGLMVDCVFSGHRIAGAVIRGKDANPLFRGCTFAENRSAGVWVREDAGATLEGCDIHNNMLAGAAADKGAKLALLRCQIHHGKDAGVLVMSAGWATVVGCEIRDHVDSGVVVQDAGSASVSHCRLEANRRGEWRIAPGGSVSGLSNQPPAPSTPIGVAPVSQVK